MNLVSLKTWKKYHWGNPWDLEQGYELCGTDFGYNLWKSVNPKDAAKLVIHEVFDDSKHNIEEWEFVYVARYYRGNNNLQDTLEIWGKRK